jgi:mono/diheme cytochrome c family protein
MADVANNKKTLVALFERSTQVKPLIEKLRQAGVPPDRIEVISGLPLHDIEVAGSSRIPLYALTMMGGFAGIGVGLFFAAGTAVFYPIMTGGKPLVAPPVVGIISFETMMLLAIVTTFVAMVIRLKPGGRPAPARDPRIDDGAVAVSIHMDGEGAQPAAVEALLKEAGASEITRVEREPVPTGQAAGMDSGNAQLWLWLGCAALAFSSITACSRDMEEQASYQSQEAPRKHSPPGSIPLNSRTIRSSAPVTPDEQFDAGKRLFRINCVHCHGSNGGGDGPVAGYLRELPKNLLAPHVQRQSVAALYAIVTNGKDLMPSFKGELSATERWAVAQYVTTLSPAAATAK